MWTAESLENAMRPKVTDAAASALLGELAETLARVLNGELKQEDAKAELDKALPLFKALDHQTVEGESAQLDFREASVEGDVNVQNVAGRDITIVNIGGTIFAIGEVTLYFETELRLVGELGPPVPLAQLVAIAKRTLGTDPLGSGVDPLHEIARALLRTDFQRLTEFVGQLANINCRGAQTIVDIAAPFCWISRKATAIIPRVPGRPPGERGIGINATLTETAQNYVACAPIPRRMYEVVPVSGRNSDDPMDVVAGIYDSIASKVGWTVEECKANLPTYPLSLFVVLPDAPDADRLATLRATFSTVTFVLMTGELRQPEFAALGLPYVDYLVPELKPGDETIAWKQVATAKLMARCTTT
jgi:hypothetical protein